MKMVTIEQPGNNSSRRGWGVQTYVDGKIDAGYSCPDLASATMVALCELRDIEPPKDYWRSN